MRACLRALLPYKVLVDVLYKWPYIVYIGRSFVSVEHGWLRSVCAFSQSDQTLLFRIASEMDVHT